MYRIKVRNNETGVIFYEYGFTRRIMKSIHYYFNKQTCYDFSLAYDVLEVYTLIFSLKTLKKCLTNCIIVNDVV